MLNTRSIVSLSREIGLDLCKILCCLRRAFNKYLGTVAELKQKPVDQVPADEGIIIPATKSNVINPRKLNAPA